ncbi:ralBP1-associated Eps domain-containing protein 1 [Culicoides brevitarsis]|uniref:ralBP1-associated Eps domain-containing protein 1 n=1 Tax=Culicoides brevitarsis TaxID=469753 RepID=UPI00307CBE61
MDDLELDTAQERYFHDLFLCCESEGKVPALRATELFRSANLSNQIITQITLLAGVPQTALHLSKRQFYSCLKLISAHQANLPLREEIITSSMVALSLPKFNWKDSPPLDGTSSSSSAAAVDRNGIIDKQGTGSSTTSANRQWIEVRSPDLIELAANKNDAGTHEVGTSDLQSTDSEVEPGEQVPRKGSPEAWSTASDSPTPTNSVVADRPWAKGAMWLCEEQRQLLGTEEESSDRHSSDDDHDIDLESVYQILPEQQEYYVKQFRAVQPDINGLLSGHIAKVFFEKSRIPVDELRHIWQLCDVTRDGALSLNEFIAAMHLVVLRRNNIPIPATLPPNLVEKLQLVAPSKQEAAEADLLHLESDDNNEHLIPRKGRDYTKAPPLPATSSSSSKQVVSRPESSSPSKADPSSPDSSSTATNVVTKTTTTKKEWTKFPESPTSSNLSSPGPKPVNFDLQRTTQAIVSDPQILHPVPLRVTPEVVDEDLHRRKTTESGLVYEAGVIIRENTSPKVQNSTTTTSHSRDSSDIRPIQRPQPKKMSSKGAIPPPPQREPSLTTTDSIDAPSSVAAAAPVGPNHSFAGLPSKKEPPPLPPPRPNRHHRSSSLDLKKLKLGNDEQGQPTTTGPHLQPMASYDGYMESGNAAEFANFAHFPDGSKDNKASGDHSKQPPQPFPRSSLTNSLIGNRSSAFEVYRKPNHTSSSRNSQSPHEVAMVTAAAAVNGNTMSQMEYEKRVIAISDNLRLVRIKPGETMVDVLKHLKEQNHLLLRLCNDLSEELLGVQYKREELRLKIENAATSANNGQLTSNQANI